MTTTHHLESSGATLAYDVDGPLPTTDGRPPLLMIGQPMEASGFATLAGYMADRTVIRYDPRGLGRSVRHDGAVEHDPVVQAEDVHRLIAEVGGPVDLFASSGGAITALALVATHPDDVATLVAHEPPLLSALPDTTHAYAAEAAVQAAYHARGRGHGMAAFIRLTSWQGEFTDAYAAQPLPDPAEFGMPVDDDGTRSDPLLSGIANAVTAYRPDWAALRAAPTRIVMAYGIESVGLLTGRATVAAATALGQPATEFPSHHGGFLGGEFGYAGQPEAFAARLHEVLDAP
ncbi:MAG: alpha/beta fold hydrolase [Propionibacteriaceae bacterium]